LTLHYAQALMTQMTQTVVCNRHHPVTQQLCRWLLLSLDRLPSNVVLMTDGLVANMLGVRMRGVMTAAGKLQAEGIIKYHEGPHHGAESREDGEAGLRVLQARERRRDPITPSKKRPLA
jgi:CRP-like cAMP-binding protein